MNTKKPIYNIHNHSVKYPNWPSVPICKLSLYKLSSQEDTWIHILLDNSWLESELKGCKLKFSKRINWCCYVMLKYCLYWCKGRLSVRWFWHVIRFMLGCLLSLFQVYIWPVSNAVVLLLLLLLLDLFTHSTGKLFCRILWLSINSSRFQIINFKTKITYFNRYVTLGLFFTV